VIWIIAGEMAVFPDSEFGVVASVGNSFVLAHPLNFCAEKFMKLNIVNYRNS
jgi:hypothetical protein